MQLAENVSYSTLFSWNYFPFVLLLLPLFNSWSYDRNRSSQELSESLRMKLNCSKSAWTWSRKHTVFEPSADSISCSSSLSFQHSPVVLTSETNMTKMMMMFAKHSCKATLCNVLRQHPYSDGELYHRYSRWDVGCFRFVGRGWQLKLRESFLPCVWMTNPLSEFT